MRGQHVLVCGVGKVLRTFPTPHTKKMFERRRCENSCTEMVESMGIKHFVRTVDEVHPEKVGYDGKASTVFGAFPGA
ncbi:hypothetical protein KDI_36950 [Dictyobacter arantiisoli]|uniref:Uncharacterized protein n=1 Tax=Dictyobacter arantiisoli TaxID=2014874 RepID=A0A5A5TEY7_9CHLR|nr:hypothetical protein KDI_36950 [Dictyobacter arantiisoli]